MEENKYSGYGYDAKPERTDDFETIREWFRLCVRKWHWFVVSIVLTCSLALLYILKTPPTYTRIAGVLLKSDAGSMSTDFGFFSSMGTTGGRTNLYNEMQTFKSPTYMVDVVKDLHLDMNYSIPGIFHDQVLYGDNLPITVSLPDLEPEEFASLSVTLLEDNKVILADFERRDLEDENKQKRIKTSFGTVTNTPVGKVIVNPTPQYNGAMSKPIMVSRWGLEAATNSYVSKLNVDFAQKRSSVLALRVNDVSPRRAEDVLNSLFKVYNQKWVDDINQQAISTSKFIDEELRQIEHDLGSVDADISEYKSRNLVPDVAKASELSMNRAEITSSQLMDFSNQLFMAKYIKKQLTDEKSKYKPLPANSGINNSSVSSQILAYNEKLTQRNSMAANSSASNPLVVDLDQNLSATREAIIASLDNVIAVLSNRISDLKTSENKAIGKIASSPSQEKYLLSVERQQKVKEQLYIFLLQKREENQLSKAFTAYNTKLLNPPSGSKKPTKPVKLNVFIIAITLGLLLPMMLLFIISNMDTAVHSRRDLDVLSIPFIGEIPLSYKKFSGLLSIFNKRKEVREIVVKEKSGNAINEAFRVARTNLEFIIGKEDGCKVIMLTSTFAGSGKTYISANMATSFAIKGKKTLLVDLDMRKSSLSTFVNSPSKGIADFLTGHIDNIDDVIVRGSINPLLDVIPVGTIPPNPTELLFGGMLEPMLEEMRKRYEYIFIDCPPLDIVADASIINKLSDVTIFVIRSGRFDKAMLPDVERMYQEKRYNNMVMILNGTYDEYSGNGYRSYGYGYGYGYGYHSKK